MGFFRNRAKRIRGSRANLALAAAGCALLLLAPLWRLAVAPALQTEPTDIERVLYYDGTLTRHAEPPDRPAIGPERRLVPVRIEREELSQPLISTPRVAVMKVEARLRVPETRELLARRLESFSLDRKTGKMLKGSETGRMSGYLLVFPFNTPKGPVEFWSEPAGGPATARFTGTETRKGLGLYRFEVAFRDKPTAVPPEGFPPALSGAQLKRMLSMPRLPVSDLAEGRATYTAGARLELLVEPRAGNIVDIRGAESVSLRSVEFDAGQALRVSKPLLELEYAQTPFSLDRAARFAGQELSKFRLQFAYIPIGLAALGAILLTVGFLALPKL